MGTREIDQLIREEIFDDYELQIDYEFRKERHLRENGYIPPFKRSEIIN